MPDYMKPRFQFSIGNMLRATAWAAGSCGAWALVLDGIQRREFWRPGGELVVQLGLAFLIFCAPILAVAALFGRAQQAIIPSLLFGVAAAIVLMLVLPTIQ